MVQGRPKTKRTRSLILSDYVYEFLRLRADAEGLAISTLAENLMYQPARRWYMRKQQTQQPKQQQDQQQEQQQQTEQTEQTESLVDK